jgi:hypothetical protein
LSKTSKNTNKKLKNVKQEKESLIVLLFESHVLIDSLKFENTMFLDTIDALENKLEKFSSDNLKNMLFIHSDISNKPTLIVDDLSTSTSHTSDSKLDSIDVKPLIVDTSCLENSCLKNCVKPKCKDTGTHVMVSFSLLVIIAGRLVILDQIVNC